MTASDVLEQKKEMTNGVDVGRIMDVIGAIGPLARLVGWLGSLWDLKGSASCSAYDLTIAYE